MAPLWDHLSPIISAHSMRCSCVVWVSFIKQCYLVGPSKCAWSVATSAVWNSIDPETR